MRIPLSIALLTTALGPLSAQEPSQSEDLDPFGDAVAKEPEPGPKKIKFRGGNEIEVSDDRLEQVNLNEINFDFDLSKLTEAESKGIEDRRAIRGFDRPKAMWRIDHGFLGAYDGGEFGGALYHFSDDGTQRTLIAGEHVEDIIRVGESKFLAAGGLEHLDFGTGCLISIERKKDRSWSTNVIARFFDGVAGIVGRIEASDSIVVSTWRTVPAGHLTPPEPPEQETRANIGSYFEIRKDGWMRYLGESTWMSRVHRSKTQTSQQDGGGKPTTRPESK